MTETAAFRLPRPEDGRVLIVEDNKFNRDLVAGVLSLAGITDLAFAADGAEGLVRVAEFDPDLVILDLMMPVMDGHEFLRRLKADPARQDLPVLVATAITDQDTRNATFDGGAVDYIEKPIDRRELTARVTVHLKNRLLLRHLQRFHDRLAQDLATARSMQEALLPSPTLVGEIATRYGLKVESLFTPSDELGGDLWGLIPIDDHRLAAFTADFTGHGVAASINTFRLHVLLDRLGPRADPAELLARLNAELLPILTRGQFATMAVAVIDRSDHSLTVASAGGPTPIVGRGGYIRRLPLGAPALGITPDAAFVSRRMEFPPGSFVLMYSDAMIESTDPGGAQLGEAGLAGLVAEAFAIGGDRPLAHLATALRDFSHDRVADDLTAAWLSW